MLRRILTEKSKGYSVRHSIANICGGDAKMMLRYQNKYRNMLKKQPDEVRAVAGALSEFGRAPRRAALAAAILSQFERAYALLEQGQQAELLARYRSRLCCIGRPVTVIGAAGRYEALCTGLDENGHLLVRDADGHERILSSGEISIRL